MRYEASRRSAARLLAACACTLLLATSPVLQEAEQDHDHEGPASEEVVPIALPAQHGWAATLDDGENRVRTWIPAAAFVLAQGESLLPSVGAKGLEGGLVTILELPGPGRYRFALATENLDAETYCFHGTPKNVSEGPRAAGEPITRWNTIDTPGETTDWVVTDEAYLMLIVNFRRQGDLPCLLRVEWEKEFDEHGGFPRQPIPARLCRPLPVTANTVEGYRDYLDARMLIEGKGCTNCHQPQTDGGAPLASRPAPDLGGVGGRISLAWMERWIRSPQTLRPQADMPELLHLAADPAAEARALAHYLASLKGEPAPPSPIATAESIAEGRLLYHTVGCIACHGPTEPAAAVLEDESLPASLPAGTPRAPLGDLEGKWRPGALTELLLNPLSTHTDGRMPSLALSRKEAEAIADYLVSRWGPAREVAVDKREAALGETLFVERRCSACHPLAGKRLAAEPGPRFRRSMKIDIGCLSGESDRAPRYDVRKKERDRFVHLLGRSLYSNFADSPIYEAEQSLRKYACLACHELEGSGGLAGGLLPYFSVPGRDGERSYDAPRDLSEVGFELSTAWLRAVLEHGAASGTGSLRMPHYGTEEVARLAQELAWRIGVRAGSDVPAPEPTDARIAAGRELVGSAGLACIECHTFDGRAGRLAEAAELKHLAPRLRYEWWRTYVHDPRDCAREDAGFAFGTGERSRAAGVLEGDLARQAEALWSYLGLGEYMPPPEGLEPAAGMVVGSVPLVVATPLDGEVDRGVAAGFPVALHVGFDTREVRLIEAWRGDFLGAGGLWGGRAGEGAADRSPIIWSAPAGVPLLVGDEPEAWPAAVGAEAGLSFEGFGLAADGSPSFRYTLGRLEVEEQLRVSTSPTARITRRFEVKGLKAGEWVWLRPGGKDSKAYAGDGCTVLARSEAEDGLRHWLSIEDWTGPVIFFVEVLP